MNKKVIAVIGVLILIVILFVFLNQKEEKKELTFSEGIKEINSLWEKNKVNSSYLINDSTELKFSSSDLESLKEDLIFFQDSLDSFKSTEETTALEDFVEIHLLLVDELDLALKVKEVQDKLSGKEINGDNLCENKSDLKFLGENTILLNDKMHSVNKLIYAFNEIHSGFEEKANLSSFIADESAFSETELENELVLGELERLC